MEKRAAAGGGMSALVDRPKAIVCCECYAITAHAFVKLEEDALIAGDVVSGLIVAVVVEEYPDYYGGPSVLILQRDRHGGPVHAVGIPKDKPEPGDLFTAYQPGTMVPG